MASVIISERNGWFSTFLVDGKTTVKTVDIYTYQCQSCENNMDCMHTMAVTAYIEQQMDLYFSACELPDMVYEMNLAIDKLKQYVDTYQKVKELIPLVQEMKLKIKALKTYVIMTSF